MLECRDGRLYTGITTDIKRRLTEHNAGAKGARFTRANPPTKLLAVQKVTDRSAALKLEAALKKLNRPQKQAWATENKVSKAVSIHRTTT
ncbi:MAG: GIY-YIG nuclease family protein [Gammaproteobacteria bacterium]|nr:GIY-YIG nuclease family protein [Gammaproteobacteria bacterium]